MASPPWVTAAPIPRRRRHRTVFLAAGAYNIAWGLFTVAYPQWLFDLAGMPPANHPQIFATLGTVIGLYGILYLAVGAYPYRQSRLRVEPFVEAHQRCGAGGRVLQHHLRDTSAPLRATGVPSHRPQG